MDIITTEIKPLSVNEGYQGRRFKTYSHRMWEKSVLWLLPKNYPVPDGDLEIYLCFGFSTKSSDWDNCIKHFQDCLAKKYGFNDKRIRRAVIEVDSVKKGKEFIKWQLNTLHEPAQSATPPSGEGSTNNTAP